MPNYSKSGKNLFPLTDQQFKEVLDDGKFAKTEHKAFTVALFYYGVRVTEALRATRSQFDISETHIRFDVGERLKKRKWSKKKQKEIVARGILRTHPLPLRLNRPYVNLLKEAIESTEPDKRVFPYCRKTGYNICDRAFHTYPHRFRLSNFTRIAQEKGIAVLKSWSALTLVALEYYMGVVDIEERDEG